MTASSVGPKSRNWADLVAIVTGVALIGLAMWPGPQSASAGAARESGNPQLLWLSHACAGALALGAVAAAQRWSLRPLARGLLILGGLGLLSVLLVFRDFGPRALLTAVLPALLLLGAATAIGPMPRDMNVPD
ncbi:MAG TPA: hypothetical protein VM076_09955 [Gemmatimonadaceae bacterium]|nr:hypothetical protein [Gemmatimonadaceae bacterium]